MYHKLRTLEAKTAFHTSNLQNSTIAAQDTAECRLFTIVFARVTGASTATVDHHVSVLHTARPGKKQIQSVKYSY